MRRRSEPHTDERLNEEKARIEAELEATEPGPQRDLLGLMLSQIKTALHIDRWRHRLTSTDIRALLIDPFACKLSEVNIHRADLDAYRELLSHPTMPVMEVSAPIEMPDVCQSDVALVDENGMIHWCERYWWIGPTDVDHHPLAGKGLIVGAPDADGKFTSCRSTIATRPQTDPPLRGSGEVVEAKAPVCYICVMKRDEAISRLQQHEADLKRLGVEHLYMFGSTARNEAGDASDVDLFFDHEKGKLGLFELMDVKGLSASILGGKIDIMTGNSLHPRLRKRIEEAAVLIF